MATLSKKSSYPRNADDMAGVIVSAATVEAAATTKAKASRSGARTAAPSHDQIAARAYELFVARGSSEGHAEEDWLRAEAELRGGQS